MRMKKKGACEHQVSLPLFLIKWYSSSAMSIMEMKCPTRKKEGPKNEEFILITLDGRRMLAATSVVSDFTKKERKP